MVHRLSLIGARTQSWWLSRGALGRDGYLYASAAVFAIAMGWTSNQPAQWHWGYLAVGPYAGAAVVALVAARRVLRREVALRLILLVPVVLGAVAIPLGLEARWRHLDHGAGFAQPEVSVIERSATLVSRGQDPYRTYVHDGHVVNAVKGVPTYESFFPYFPLMSVFGLPSAATHNGSDLTDARIIMSLMTLLASGLALALLRAPRERKILVAMVLLALPTGALFLSTGGDDMPILALLLLGVAFLQRRSNYLAGVSFAVAAAMKLTAWPLVAGSLLVARSREGRRAWLPVALVVTTVVVATTLPYAWRAPHAFIANVFAFPLGLAGVRSPAASPLPGHVVTTIFPILGHLLAPATLVIGGYFATRYVRAHWPVDLSQLLMVVSALSMAIILMASATRVGYVIYPLNFALWGWVCRVPQEPSRSVGLERRGVLVDPVGP